jgi:anthranilate phosphoribosyltransferase
MNTLLQHLLNKQDLDEKKMSSLMQHMMQGEMDEILMAGILVALNAKGETIDEIYNSAKVMQTLSHRVLLDIPHLVDIAGTGGDGQSTFNISTTSAFVAASSGVTIAKHGNRSASSKSGSADVLEAAGINLNIDTNKMTECIKALNIAFMFTPNHHPAARHARHVRKILGVKTIFNLLGPLNNPAGAKRQVVGVFNDKWVRPICDVFKKLGSQHSLVVHSEDGLDEFSIFNKTKVAELKDGKIVEYDFNPVDFGLAHPKSDVLKVKDPKDSLTVLYDVLNNKKGPRRDIVILNAGATIYASGLVSSLKDGFVMAENAIASKKALHCFEQYKIRSNA